KAVEGFSGVAPVDIAKSDDILRREMDEIGAPHAAAADAGDVQQVAGRHETAAENVAGHDSQRGRRGGLRKKFSTRDRVGFGHGQLPCGEKSNTGIAKAAAAERGTNAMTPRGSASLSFAEHLRCDEPDELAIRRRNTLKLDKGD